MSRTLFNAASRLYDFIGAGIKLEDGIGVLIMGGSSDGLGIEICTALAIDWNIHVVNLDTKDMELVLNSKEASLMNRNYTFVPCRDFTRTELVVEALTKVKELQLPIKILINHMQEGLRTVFNPSFLMGNSAVARMQDYVDANVSSVVVTTKFFMNVLVPQTKGLLDGKASFYIVNLTTVLTLRPPSYALEYVSSKAALNQFHDGLTSELAMTYKRGSFKTLLIFLPRAKDGHTWETLSTDLCRQVVELLEVGRRGCATLRVSADFESERKHGKMKQNYRYESSKWRPEWCN